MNENVNCNTKRLYVDYNGAITDKSYPVIVKTLEYAIRQYNFNEIYFCLSSGGGSVNAGLEIYSYLKNLRNIHVITHGYSYIGSIANIIFFSWFNKICIVKLHLSFTWNYANTTRPIYNKSIR